MPEQDPSYHPVVESEIHTSGPDIGRTKNTEIAYENSLNEAMVRDNITGGAEPDSGWKAVLDENLRTKLAQKAVSRSTLPEALAKEATGEIADVNTALDDAKNNAYTAATDYDSVMAAAREQDEAGKTRALKEISELASETPEQ